MTERSYLAVYRKTQIRPGVYDTPTHGTEVLTHSRSLAQAAASRVGLTWQS